MHSADIDPACDAPVDSVETADKDVTLRQRLKAMMLRVAYRIFHLFGEFTALALGLIFFWTCAINILVSQKTLDISFLKPNAALWFASAFDGQTADVGTMILEWNAVDNTITFEATNIVVKDASEAPIQTINRLQSDLALRDVLRAKLDPIAILINGGQLTYKRGEDGRVIAGLGTPSTVGALGPVWSGGARTRKADTRNFQLERAQFRDVTIFVQDAVNDMDMTLLKSSLLINRADDKIQFEGEAILQAADADDQSDITIAGAISDNLQDFNLTLDMNAFNPIDVLPKAGPLSQGRILDATMDFNAIIKANAVTGLTALSLDVEVGEGRLVTADRRDAFRAAGLSADYNVEDMTLNVTELSIDSNQITANGTATLGGIGTPANGFFAAPLDYTLNMRDVRLDLTPKFDAPLLAKTLTSHGTWDKSLNLMAFNSFKADFGPYQFDLSGQLDRDDKGAPELVVVNGKINGTMTRENLLELWPSNYILGARNWIKNSVIKGDLSNFDIALRADAEALAQPALPNEALVMTFDLVNTDIRYIKTMTPVTGARGRGKLEGNRTSAVLDSGKVGNITLSNGTVEIPRIYPYGGQLNIAADGEGPVQDLLSLIDEKPFEYVSRYGVKSDNFTGSGKVRLSLSRPLRERISYSDIDYTMTGTLSDVTAPFALGDYSLNNGNVTMLVDRNSLSVKGPVRLGTWDADLAWNETFDAGATPTRYRINGVLGRDDLDGFGLGFREFIDGDIEVEIDAVADGLDISGASVTADLSDTDLRLGPYWSKDAGVDAHMTGDMSFTKVAGLGLNNIQIQAPGLDVTGSLDLASDFRLINLDLSRAKIAGFIDATVQMKPSPEKDRFNALVTGNYLDVSPFVAGMVGGDGVQTLDVPILLTAALGRLALNEAYVLRDANVLFAHDGVGVRQARLKGVGENGDVTLDLQTDDEKLQRVLKVDIPSASDAAFAFLGLESVTAGLLKLEATMPITTIDGPIIGTVSMVDMQLVGAPIMTRILSLASLQGLADAMSGEGLRFETAEIPFSLEGYNLSIRDARASGPALGMTGEGEMNFSEKTMDVNGVLVPAYTANSLLGDIPLIGDIFVGKKGEGIFALNYTVRGPFEKSQVAVNPLSALTPGFLRRIFSPQREKLPEQVIETIESVRPTTD